MSANANAFMGSMELTLRQMVKSKKYFILLFITCAPVLLVTYALQQPDIDDPYLFLNEFVNIFYLQIVMILITLINSTSVIREEISNKTVSYLVTRAISRQGVASSKFIAQIPVNYSLVATPILIAYAYVGMVEGGLGNNLDTLGAYLALICVGVVVYSAFFYFLGVVLKHPLMIGLLFAFLWEVVLSNMPGRIPYVTILFYIRSLGSGMIDYGSIAMHEGISPLNALMAIAALTLLLLALSRRRFSKMDLL